MLLISLQMAHVESAMCGGVASFFPDGVTTFGNNQSCHVQPVFIPIERPTYPVQSETFYCELCKQFFLNETQICPRCHWD